MFRARMRQHWTRFGYGIKDDPDETYVAELLDTLKPPKDAYHQLNKILNFGLLYGMSSTQLGQQVFNAGLDTAEQALREHAARYRSILEVDLDEPETQY
jgi:hypothetical protein